MADAEKKDLQLRDASDDGSHSIPRRTGLKGFYYNPTTQVVMLGFVCFMCPGLFNALTGLGGGGQLDESTAANANVALYSAFAFFAFFAGSINNKIGARRTLQIGTAGYPIYIGSFLSLNMHPNSKGFVIAAGGILGFCAALLWTAQGSLMMAYPTEINKGKYIGIFWGIFNLGGVMGGAISLGQNFHSTANAVGNGTYIAFLILTCIGFTIPMFMANPDKMIRSDGSKVTVPRHPSWKTEFIGLWYALRDDPYIVLLFPMFFSSNWFYTWQFNDFNGSYFNIRGRSLNNVVYWSSQIVGSIAIGLLLDSKSLTRRSRAFAGWVTLFAMVFIIHIWGYQYQKEYTRASVSAASEFVTMDIRDKGYPQRVIFYVFCGLLDAMWQTALYWMMGAMSNDPAKLAYLAGFYKSIQSAGNAGVWRADAVRLPFMNIFLSTWILLVGGLIFALPMLYYRVKNHTELEEETIARMDDSGRIQPVEKFYNKE